MNIAHMVEAIKPRLGHIRHDVPVGAEDIIREWPSNEVRVRNAPELVLGDNFLPDRTLIGHMLRETNCLLLRETNCLRISKRHFEDCCDLGPKVSPATFMSALIQLTT